MPTGLASYLPDKPTTLHEAKVSPEWPQRRGALKREISSQIGRVVWKVVDRPKEKNIFGTKTVSWTEGRPGWPCRKIQVPHRSPGFPPDQRDSLPRVIVTDTYGVEYPDFAGGDGSICLERAAAWRRNDVFRGGWCGRVLRWAPWRVRRLAERGWTTAEGHVRPDARRTTVVEAVRWRGDSEGVREIPSRSLRFSAEESREGRHHHGGLRRRFTTAERNEAGRAPRAGRHSTQLPHQGSRGDLVLSGMSHYSGPQGEDGDVQSAALRANDNWAILNSEDQRVSCFYGESATFEGRWVAQRRWDRRDAQYPMSRGSRSTNVGCQHDSSWSRLHRAHARQVRWQPRARAREGGDESAAVPERNGEPRCRGRNEAIGVGSYRSRNMSRYAPLVIGERGDARWRGNQLVLADA